MLKVQGGDRSLNFELLNLEPLHRSLLQKKAAQPIKRCLRSADNDLLTPAVKLKSSRLMIVLLRDADPHRAHGFFTAAAARTGDAGDAEAHARAGSFSYPV